MLLPWNSTINSTSWLKVRLEHTSLLGSFLNWIGVVNTWVTLAVGLISFLIPRPKSTASRRFDSIQIALFIIAAVFVADTLLTLIPLPPYALFAAMLLLLTVSTVAAGILQLDVFALVAAEYPPVMMQGIAMGQVMCAVALSLFSMSAVALEYLDQDSVGDEKKHHGHKGKHGHKDPKDPDPSPSPPETELEGRAWWLYFFLCFVPVAATITLYSMLPRTNPKEAALEDEYSDYSDEEEGDEREDLLPATPERAVTSSQQATTPLSDEEERYEWDDRVDEDEALIWTEAASFSDYSDYSETHGVGTAAILWDTRFLSLAVFLTFSITLALYPALTAAVIPSSPGALPTMYSKLFVPLGFLCSGVGDWIGRSIPARPAWILTNQPLVLLLTASRAGFLFLFAGCNVDFSGSERASPIPPIFAKDWWFFLFVFIFFVSHGYLSTIALMQAPGCVEHRGGDAKRTAGALMSIVLFCGLAVGSACSFGVRYFIFGEIF